MSAINTSTDEPVDFPNDLAEGEVLELTGLGIFFTASQEMPVTGSSFSYEVDIQTRTGELVFDDQDLIYRVSQEIQTTAARTAEHASVVYDKMVWIDLTDKKGVGIMVPADRLWVALDTANYAAVLSCVTRIYYRVVKVSTKEVLEFLTSSN